MRSKDEGSNFITGHPGRPMRNVDQQERASVGDCTVAFDRS